MQRIHRRNVFSIALGLSTYQAVENAGLVTQYVPPILLEHVGDEQEQVPDFSLRAHGQLLRERSIPLIALQVQKIMNPKMLLLGRLRSKLTGHPGITRTCELQVHFA